MTIQEVSPPVNTTTYTGPDRRYDFALFNGTDKRAQRTKPKAKKARTLFLESDILEVEIVSTPMNVSEIGQHGHMIQSYNNLHSKMPRGMFVDTIV